MSPLRPLEPRGTAVAVLARFIQHDVTRLDHFFSRFVDDHAHGVETIESSGAVYRGDAIFLQEVLDPLGVLGHDALLK